MSRVMVVRDISVAGGDGGDATATEGRGLGDCPVASEPFGHQSPEHPNLVRMGRMSESGIPAVDHTTAYCSICFVRT